MSSVLAPESHHPTIQVTARGVHVQLTGGDFTDELTDEDHTEDEPSADRLNNNISIAGRRQHGGLRLTRQVRRLRRASKRAAELAALAGQIVDIEVWGMI